MALPAEFTTAEVSGGRSMKKILEDALDEALAATDQKATVFRAFKNATMKDVNDEILTDEELAILGDTVDELAIYFSFYDNTNLTSPGLFETFFDNYRNEHGIPPLQEGGRKHSVQKRRVRKQTHRRKRSGHKRSGHKRSGSTRKSRRA